MTHAGLTKLVESFLASTCNPDDAGANGEGEEGDGDKEGLVDDGGPEELLRLLTSDEVGGFVVFGWIVVVAGGWIVACLFMYPPPTQPTPTHTPNLITIINPPQGACYLIEDSTSGRHRVRCNARMAAMFVSTEEMQGLMDQTGLAVGHLMMRCVHICLCDVRVLGCRLWVGMMR